MTYEVIVIIVLRVINDKVFRFRLLGTTHVQFGILAWKITIFRCFQTQCFETHSLCFMIGLSNISAF